MLDEPLGSLDRALREELMNELRAILERVGVTAIYVTHDQQEAFAVADWVIVMNQGRIAQQDKPQALYRHPASPWVARFLGLTNLIPGRMADLDPRQVDTPLGRFALGEVEPVTAGLPVMLLIRPEAARFTTRHEDHEGMAIEGIVRQSSFRGGHHRLVIHHEAGFELVFELTTHATDLPQPGQPITLALRPEAMSLLAEKKYE
ncbi:ABC transporter ATP-binding protein [Chloroflexota bacterium]